MTGRGIDQALPRPSDPLLYESYVRDARTYVQLAERVNGPIARPVTHSYVWGAALAVLAETAPDARIVNLETSITSSDTPWPGKGIHYRMHPGNVGCLAAAAIDCCVLANNHVLDWGRDGLEETLAVLGTAGIYTAGAGRTLEEARAPAALQSRRGRVLVFGCGFGSSGIPRDWEAKVDRPGIWRLPELGARAAEVVAREIAAHRRPTDVVVLSVHWGGNWGYEIPAEQRVFAHALIDAGAIDILHGHSSHHAKGIEVYRGKPILYGCGDFVNDYEGIAGHERYRGDLALMYFVTFDLEAGQLRALEIMPLRRARFSLERAAAADSAWLAAMLTEQGLPLGTAARPATAEHIRLLF